jgi:hypothetical protein
MVNTAPEATLPANQTITNILKTNYFTKKLKTSNLK